MLDITNFLQVKTYDSFGGVIDDAVKLSFDAEFSYNLYVKIMSTITDKTEKAFYEMIDIDIKSI